MSGRLIVLSGPSGVGKGTVLSAYLKSHPATWVSVSAATRAPRPGERDGVHYFFLSRAQFEQKIDGGGMLEWAQYNNEYYGTPRDAVEEKLAQGRDVVLEIEVQGAMQVRSVRPDAVLIFIMPPSFQTLRERLVGRGTEDATTVDRRLRAAVGEIRRAGEYDFIIINDTVERAAAALGTAVAAAKHLTNRNESLLMEVMNDAQTYFVAN